MGFWKSLFGGSAPPPAAPLVTDLLRVEGSLSAYFKQPAGPSRPGLDWKMTLTHPPQTTFFVRTYFASGSPAAGEEAALLHQAVDFASARLAAGWTPGPGEMIEAAA